MDAETKKFLEKHFEKVETSNEKTRRYFDDKTIEIKRHFGVVAENLDNNIKLLAEQVTGNTQKLEEHDQCFAKIDDQLSNIENRLGNVENRLGNVENRLGNVESRLDNIEVDLNIIKKDLKQKVSYDEFNALEQRVIMLESKTAKI